MQNYLLTIVVWIQESSANGSERDSSTTLSDSDKDEEIDFANDLQIHGVSDMVNV